MFKVNYCDYNRSNNDYDKICRPCGSGDYLFLFFLTPMKIKLGDEFVISKENAFLLFPKDSVHEYMAIKKFKNSFIHFSSDDDDFISKYNLPTNKLIYLPEPEAINNTIKEIYLEFSTKNSFHLEKTDLLIQKLFIDFQRGITALPYNNGADNLYEIFHKARVEILTHIEKDWTSKSMSALTNLGTSQFYNYYKYFFLHSPKSELLDARIQRAKFLLKIDKLPVNQVALLSGFNNISHFTRYFKKTCGISPTEYSKNI